MIKKAVVILGHSHVTAVNDALALRVDSGGENDSTHIYVHDVWKNRTNYSEGLQFNQSVLDAVNRVVPSDRQRHYVSVLGGNGHILLSLNRHSRPFDVVLPEQPDLPLDPNAEILPSAYLAKILLPFMHPYIWQLVSYRQAVGTRIHHIGPPPPCGDDEYMRAHMGSYVPDPNNIVSRFLRLKMWRMHSQLMADVCAKNDIGFLAAPEESVDDEGFLRPEGYGQDATHANSWYGELLVAQIEKLTGGRCGGFTRFAEG